MSHSRVAALAILVKRKSGLRKCMHVFVLFSFIKITQYLCNNGTPGNITIHVANQK